jgi:SAM-dependent methyltransferase
LTKNEHYWESVAAQWETQRPHGLWRIHADEVNARLLDRWLGTCKYTNILKTDLFDEAFGPGLYTRLLPRSEFFTGIDISYNVARVARSSHEGLISLCADTRSLPFGDSTFGVVVSNSSLDHFRTKDQIVKSVHELYRVLKCPGRLLLTLDNPVNPMIALRHALPYRLLHKTGVVPYFVGASLGPWRLRKVLESIGFKVKQVDAVLHCPRVIAVFLAHFVEKKAGPEGKKAFLRGLMSFEHLSRLPTRFLTGYFVAADARKR